MREKLIVGVLALLCSFNVFADCEGILGYWKVGYPQASANQTISFLLTNSIRSQIWVDAKQWEQADPVHSRIFNELYHAAYENKRVNFGVTSDVCNDIENYIGVYRGDGVKNVLTVSKMMNIQAVGR